MMQPDTPPDAAATIAAREHLIERLADLEHDRWSGWMKYLFTKGFARDDGAFVIDPESVHWWMHLIETPYADLTERSKESDREEVRKTLDLVESLQAAELAAALARIAVLEAAIRRWVEARGAYNGQKGQAWWFGDVVLAEMALADLLADAGAAGTEETALERLQAKHGLDGGQG